MVPPTPLTGMTRIDLLRHGETQGGSRFRGRGDDPLTALGWAQMWSALRAPPRQGGGAAAGRTGREGPTGEGKEPQRIDLGRRPVMGAWDLILASPLARCADFARALSRQEGIPLRLDARLQEMDFGAWEGQSAADLMARDAEALGRFWSDPLANTPPGAEPLAQFADRVLDLWSELLTRPEGEALLVISHGGVIRVILSQVLGRPLGRLLELEVGHASLNRIHVTRHAADFDVSLAEDRPGP